MPHKLLAAMAAALLLATAATAPADAQNYTVNGQLVPPEAEAHLSASGLPPGHYWFDANTGNFGIAGDANPLGNVNTGFYPPESAYAPRQGRTGGYGHTHPDGSFSRHHWSLPGGVHGDGEGCYYLEGWSNC